LPVLILRPYVPTSAARVWDMSVGVEARVRDASVGVEASGGQSWNVQSGQYKKPARLRCIRGLPQMPMETNNISILFTVRHPLLHTKIRAAIST
jgi:hypothetical protein